MLVLLGLTGCMNIPVTSRSARLREGNAPGPTLVTATVECREPPHGFQDGVEFVVVGEPHLPAIAGRMNAHVHPTWSKPLDPASCETVKHLSGDVAQQWSTRVAPADVVAAMQEVKARSALVSFARSQHDCRKVDAGWRCWEAVVFVAAVLYDATGNALWRGQKLVMHQVDEPNGGRPDTDDSPLVIYRGVPISR